LLKPEIFQVKPAEYEREDILLYCGNIKPCRGPFLFFYKRQKLATTAFKTEK